MNDSSTTSTESPPSRMRVEVLEDHEKMSLAAAARIIQALKRTPRLLICLASGASPARTFELLAQEARRAPSLFAGLRVLKLDEWAGIPADDPASCESYLRQHAVRPWNIPEDRFLGFAPDSPQPETECERIRNWLAEHGPIDLCVLGLGRNGHLGLNEPGAVLYPFAHTAPLAAETKNHNMLAHLRVKPDRGLTIGMAEILQSRQVLLLVSGAQKKEPLAHLLREEISTQFPASFLCLHPDTTILCDRDASEPRRVPQPK